MFTSKFYVDTKRSNALMLRITSNRRKSELALGIVMDEQTLADSMSEKPAPANVRWKSLLSFYRMKLDDIRIALTREGKINEEASVVRDMFKRSIEAVPESDDSDVKTRWEDYYIGYAKGKKNKSYRDSCEYTLRKMREFEPELSKFSFEGITLKWLKDFDEWLDDNGVSQNTRNIHFKNIRTCLNRAIDEELTGNYPFRRFKIRAEETRKRNLPVEELRRLFDYPVEEYQEYYLDYFKLIFMLVGINTIDLFNLTKIEDGRIEYRRAKTKRLYSIKVEPEAMEIIERHRAKNGKGLLDITDRWSDHRGFQKYCNEALKKIGTVRRVGRGGKKVIKPEWPELSTYWARHSWGTIAYSIDVPKDIISQALGHSSGLSVTEIYIERDQRKVDKANRMVLDWVLHGVKSTW